MSRRSTPKDINSAERIQLALSLRKQGLTLEEIALRCGYKDKSGAYYAIKRYLDSLPVEDAVELRKLEVTRLDALLTECWDLAMNKDNRARLFAIDRILAISERRARLLGMDANPNDAPRNATVIRQYGAEVNQV